MSGAHPCVAARPRFELLLAALVSAVLAAWFLWTPITRLGRETLSPVDALQQSPLLVVDPSWRPGNTSQVDVATEHQAAYVLDRRSFERGEWPLWDRFTGFGSPHLADPDAAVLSPFTWLHCVLPLDRAALAGAFLKLFLAGFLAYGFLAALRLAPIACGFGAISLLFSGTVIEQLGRPRSAVALALLGGLWVLEHLAHSIERDPPRLEPRLTRLTHPRHAAVFAAIIAFGVAAGDPQACAWTVLLLAAFAAARGRLMWKRAEGRPGAGVEIAAIGAQFALVGALAVSACGLFVVPFAEFLGESAILRERLIHGVSALARETLACSVFPRLFGDPAASPSSTLAAFVGPLTLFCAILAPFVVRRRRVLTFFAVTALAWTAWAVDALGVLTSLERMPVFRLVSIESGLSVLHVALAACAALLVHHVMARGPSRNVVAALVTACAALTFLFVARAGASSLVRDVFRALPDDASRTELASASAEHMSVTCTWFLAGALCIAAAFVLIDRRLRFAALACAVAVVIATNAVPLRGLCSTTPNALLFPRTAAIDDLQARVGAHRPVFIGETPMPPRVGALFGLESLANVDGSSLERVRELRAALFAADADGTDVRWASRRGLRLFGIDRVLQQGEWIGVDTWTGFAEEDSGAEFLTRPLVPDADVEFDFRYLDERTSALRVVFETGGRPLVQNIEFNLEDRGTRQRLAQHVLSPNFADPNRDARVSAIVPLPHLADWSTRELRLVIRSNDGVAETAWSLVARRDWRTIMNAGVWRKHGVAAAPPWLRHPDFTGFAARQDGRELKGSIVVDMTWNADLFREDGSTGALRVLDFVEGTPAYRTVSRALAPYDERDALEMAIDPTFDPRSAVVLEDTIFDAGTTDLVVNEPVEVVAVGPRSVRLRTTRTRPGWLVNSTPWYPGWRARVNGVERPLLRANHAFGAVALDAGTADVVLEYDPWSVRVGIWLSCIALAAISTWLFLSRGSGLSRDVRAS